MYKTYMSTFPYYIKKIGKEKKLDGVGPVDNRPSTDKLHPFVRKKRKKEKKNYM